MNSLLDRRNEIIRNPIYMHKIYIPSRGVKGGGAEGVEPGQAESLPTVTPIGEGRVPEQPTIITTRYSRQNLDTAPPLRLRDSFAELFGYRTRSGLNGRRNAITMPRSDPAHFGSSGLNVRV